MSPVIDQKREPELPFLFPNPDKLKLIAVSLPQMRSANLLNVDLLFG